MPQAAGVTVAVTVGVLATVTVWVAAQPLYNVYAIVAVPAVCPVTTPAATVATAEVLLVHVPPRVVLVRVVVEGMHTHPDPVIGAGTAYTESNRVLMQPVGRV